MASEIMPGRSVASILLLALHGLLCLQLLVARAETDDDGAIEEGSSFHLQVTAPVVPDAPEERREHFRALEAKDLLRHRRMTTMAPFRNGGGGRRRQDREAPPKEPEEMDAGDMSMELPIRSALNTAHVGMYLVSLRFGTPALPFTMALDTANDLTWLSCRLRRRKGKHYGRPSPAETLSVGVDGVPVKKVTKNYYRPALSSTWQRVRCANALCGILPYVQCKMDNVSESCTYSQRVQDETVTAGIFGQEKATVTLSDGNLAELPGLILGCSLMESGLSLHTHDGVLALGNGDASFGLMASTRFGQRFSFCLVGTNSSGNTSSYLTFGPNAAMDDPGTMQTNITYSKEIRQGFGFHVDRITVAGQPLDIPEQLWNENLNGGGVILDTGTSVTGLVSPVYDAVTAALDSHLAHLPRVTGVPGFEFCYRMSLADVDNATVPSFVMELKAGARLEPDAKSVVMPEVEPGVACLGFRRLPLGPSIIGNVLMQEHVWEFQHTNGVMKFRKDKCTGQRAFNVHPTPTPVN